MLDDLQRLVDDLARRLGRAVAIDDPHLRLIVYSAHDHEVDPVRQAVILTRKAPPKAAAWVQSLGIALAEGPIRIPGNDEFGSLPRVCIPMRLHGVRFGYLWLIDPEQGVDEADLAAAVAAGSEASVILFRDRVLGERVRARERELLAELLGTEPDTHGLAAEELLSRDAFVRGKPVRVLIGAPGSERLDEEHFLALEHDIGRFVSGLPRRHALVMMRSNHVVLLVSAEALARSPRTPELLLGSCCAAVAGDRAAMVACGSEEPDLRAAFTSYQRAMVALRVATVVPTMRPIVWWDALGVYGMLAGLPVDALRATALHPGVDALQRQAPELVETLETFLDLAGDARRTAERLGLHRASIYQRLARVERITELDLRDGEHRLAAHLSVKLTRLAGGDGAQP